MVFMGTKRLKRKPASRSTKASQTALLKNLLFQDDPDDEQIQRGYIATLPDKIIANEAGQIIRDLRINESLNNECPATVHPNLWHNLKLLSPHGLFEVIPGIYQIRGLDSANMTIIRGETGYIVIDTLSAVEVASAGMELVQNHLGELPVVALIYTRCHVDHYGGAKGVINKSDVISGRTVVIAPSEFMKEVENVFDSAGPAMNRPAICQLGSALAIGPTEAASGGTGRIHQSSTRGTTSIIPPNLEIADTGEAMVVDGVNLVFQLTPNTEAQAAMNVYLPDFKALYMAQNVNGHTDQLNPLMGAKAIDAKGWADKLTETIRLFGHDTEVLFASHLWPQWGHDMIVDFLTSHRDGYKFIHDQTLRLMNLGLTSTEIVEALTLPETLVGQWINHGNFGTWQQRAKRVYHQYMGWYDGNPAHLNPIPPETAGKKYVVAMGGTEAVLSKARDAMDKGEYQWAAELADRVLCSHRKNRKAQLLQADILEQLGYQAENAFHRNVYLTASTELRNGVVGEEKPGVLDNAEFHSVPWLLDVMSARLLPERAIGIRFKVNLEISDLEENYVLSLSNAVLVYESGVTDEDTDGTLSMDKETLWQLFDGQKPASHLIKNGKLRTSGNVTFLNGLSGLFERPPGRFTFATS
jgi:alkyl sulfatase BDS1-like metallo-beta-lactamase superfamily hydrolase